MKGSAFYGKSNQSNYGKPSMAKDYDVNKGSHGHPHEAPLKEHEKGHTQDSGDDNKGRPEPTMVTNVREGDAYKNEKGQSQADVLNSRNKNMSTYVDKVKAFSKSKGGLTPSQKEKATNKADDLSKKYVASADSINTVNKNMDIAMDKKNKAKKKKDQMTDAEFDAL